MHDCERPNDKLSHTVGVAYRGPCGHSQVVVQGDMHELIRVGVVGVLDLRTTTCVGRTTTCVGRADRTSCGYKGECASCMLVLDLAAASWMTQVCMPFYTARACMYMLAPAMIKLLKLAGHFHQQTSGGVQGRMHPCASLLQGQEGASTEASERFDCSACTVSSCGAACRLSAQQCSRQSMGFIGCSRSGWYVGYRQKEEIALLHR